MVKRYRKKRIQKKRRNYKTKVYKPLTMKKRINNEFGILQVRIKEHTEITMLSGATINAVWAPSFGLIPAAELAAYQALYDQVRFCAMKVSYVPRSNQAGTAASVNSFRMYSVIDRTDSNALTTIDEAMEYQNVKSTLMTKPHTRYCKLTTISLDRDSNNNPKLTIHKPEWLQTTSQTIGGTVYNNTIIAHLGLKFISDSNPISSSLELDVFTTYYLEFKNRK